MAEIGAVRFAHVAREVAEAALPRYRSPFSKHTFTQPMLLAILCLMRYEDWTYRETEVRLREHAKRRTMLPTLSGDGADADAGAACRHVDGSASSTDIACPLAQASPSVLPLARSARRRRGWEPEAPCGALDLAHQLLLGPVEVDRVG
jgi:hypothetical protein